MALTETKLNSLREKRAFIRQISTAFEMKPAGSSVDYIDFEAYEYDSEYLEVVEYLVVHFNGGSISVRNISGNSNIANFKELAHMVSGGYYDEVRTYMAITDSYTAINLD